MVKVYIILNLLILKDEKGVMFLYRTELRHLVYTISTNLKKCRYT